MTTTIGIPTALRPFTGGAARVDVEADTVAGAVDALVERHPELGRQLRDETGKLRSFVNIFLNDEDVRHLPDRNDTSLAAGDSLLIVPSIAGGRR